MNNVPGGNHVPPTTPLSTNIGRSQYMRSGNGNMSSRFQSMAGNHQMYEAGGYFPNYYKHQEYYGKHDIDFTNHNPKGQIGPHHVDLHNQKHDFHTASSHKNNTDLQNHIKSDFHYMKSNDLNSKMHHDFHHMKNHSFHHQNQNIYYPNHQTDSGNSTPTGPNIQYQNQYYHNDYDVASASIEQTGYYESKMQQAHYYENMNYHPNTDYTHHPHDGTAYVTPPSSLQAESCDNFAFPQYPQQYDNSTLPINTAGSTSHIPPTNVPGPPVAPAHLIAPTQHNSNIQNYVQHGYPVTPSNTPSSLSSSNHQMATPSENIVAMENSNSSSDFNFLSNLANDFAPEYYQLS